MLDRDGVGTTSARSAAQAAEAARGGDGDSPKMRDTNVRAAARFEGL